MTRKQTIGRGVFLAVLCVTSWAHVACNRQAKAPVTPLPSSNEVSGWTKTGDTRNFTASDLWNYIDGDAERYVKAGVQTTSTADYNFQNKFDAVADIYSMADMAGARTILESEPAGQATAAQFGDSARLYTGGLVFRKGRYLVRIVAYKQSPEVQQAVQNLGREIEKRLSE